MSDTKQMSYHLRVDGEYSETELSDFDSHFIDIFKITVIFAYHEISDKESKPHFHAHLECEQFEDEKALRAARKRIKDYFCKNGSKVSFTQDRGQSKQYTVKQKDRIYYRGITDGELKVLEDASYFKKDSKTKKQPEEPPMLKMYRRFMLQVEADIKSKSRGLLKSLESRDIVDNDYVTRFVVRYYHNISNKSFGIGRMAEAVSYLYCKYLWEKCGIRNNDDMTWQDPSASIYLDEEQRVVDLVKNFYVRY